MIKINLTANNINAAFIVDDRLLPVLLLLAQHHSDEKTVAVAELVYELTCETDEDERQNIARTLLEITAPNPANPAPAALI